jgi:stress response protein YsnF
MLLITDRATELRMKLCSGTATRLTGFPRECSYDLRFSSEKGTTMPDAPADEKLVIPLVSEELRLEKRETSTGKVRIQTVVETVEELACATVEEESLDVQRVPVGKVVDEPPVIRTEGDLTIIPVLKETMVVEKRLVLVEEVHIRHNTSFRQVEMPVSLRKQKAIIDSASTDKPTARLED